MNEKSVSNFHHCMKLEHRHCGVCKWRRRIVFYTV